MNIVEALKLSNKVRRAAWILGSSMTFSEGIGQYDLKLESMLSDDWEPVLPEKKTVKKKFYHALFYNKNTEKYFIPDSLFESPEKAEKYAVTYLGIKLVRFLVENPIEVELLLEQNGGK